MKKYLMENPDKVPYLLNHSSKESYPEKYFTEDILDSPIELRKSFTKNLIKNYSTSKNIDHFIWWNSDDIFGKYLSFKPEEADDLVDNGSLRTNNIFVYQLDPSISKP